MSPESVCAEQAGIHQRPEQPNGPQEQPSTEQHLTQMWQHLQAQQTMLQQMAADQQLMWQHMAGGGKPPVQEPEKEHGSEHCDHHQTPQEQAEHFMRMAEKFARGDVDMQDVAGGLSFINTQSNSFWKGLLIGGGLTFLFSNESVRHSITDLFKRGKDEE